MDINFETARLKLRPFNVSDLDAFMEYRSDLEWMQYQGFKGLSREQYINVLFKDIDLEDGNQLALVLKDTDKLIGDLYLHTDDSRICIGYSLNKKYTKQGYINEILEAVTKRCIESGYVVCAAVEKGNVDSIHVLKKLGFKYVGTNEHDELQYLKIEL